MKAKYLILFSLLTVFSTVFAGVDVNDIYIQGDSTLMGMKIESSYFSNGAFLIETTGARFEYVKGELKIFQGLDKTNRRLLSTMTFDNEPNFTKVKANDDHILLWSENLNIGIYGDSTCILAPKVKLGISFRGNFKPGYEGRYKGELLLIDDAGGMEIYPQRYEKGYEIKKIELGKIDWVADYELNAGERVMIAAFPGKPFDWVKSFKSNVVATCGAVGLGPGNYYGQMPPHSVIKSWSQTFDSVAMFFNGLYASNKPYGPYTIKNEPEFKRFMSTAHINNLKVSLYCSLFYWRHANKTSNGFVDSIRLLKEKYNIDGVYVDGLTFDSGIYKTDDKIDNWHITRQLRQLFGTEGFLMLHGTNLGTLVATSPNIDTWYNVTLNGENVEFSSLEDEYFKYHARKYGISNTVGILYTGKKWYIGPNPELLTRERIIDKGLEMNCRDWWGAFVLTNDVPPGGKYVWPTNLDNGSEFPYYLQKLADLKKQHPSSQ